MNLALIVVVMLLLAAGLATGGAYVLWGIGVSMLAAAAALVALAVALRLGMTPRG